MKDLETILKEWDRITGTHHDLDDFRKRVDEHETGHQLTEKERKERISRLVEVYGADVWKLLDLLTEEGGGDVCKL